MRKYGLLANKALPLIHKSVAPIVAPLLLSTELNRYINEHTMF